MTELKTIKSSKIATTTRFREHDRQGYKRLMDLKAKLPPEYRSLDLRVSEIKMLIHKHYKEGQTWI